MSDCNFDLQMKDTPEAFLARAQAVAKKAGGSFEGDTQKGGFEIPTPFGGIKGSYTVTGTTVDINVTDKPLLMGCGVIAEILRNKLG